MHVRGTDIKIPIIHGVTTFITFWPHVSNGYLSNKNLSKPFVTSCDPSIDVTMGTCLPIHLVNRMRSMWWPRPETLSLPGSKLCCSQGQCLCCFLRWELSFSNGQGHCCPLGQGLCCSQGQRLCCPYLYTACPGAETLLLTGSGTLLLPRSEALLLPGPETLLLQGKSLQVKVSKSSVNYFGQYIAHQATRCFICLWNVRTPTLLYTGGWYWCLH